MINIPKNAHSIQTPNYVIFHSYSFSNFPGLLRNSSAARWISHPNFFNNEVAALLLLQCVCVFYVHTKNVDYMLYTIIYLAPVNVTNVAIRFCSSLLDKFELLG